jgi:hypothetical protein
MSTTIGEITIGDTLLNYKTNEQKYIITYIRDYNPHLDTFINKIFDSIFPHYHSGYLSYGNVCGANAKYICNILNKKELISGKIIITDWVTENSEIIDTIESVYGSIGNTIRAHYHALVYLTAIIGETTYMVAIETTQCRPYQLQFYVGSNPEEFDKIIKTRYQCNNFKMSDICDKDWMAIAYNGGKKRKLSTKKRKLSTKKRKLSTKKRKLSTKKRNYLRKRKWAFK